MAGTLHEKLSTELRDLTIEVWDLHNSDSIVVEDSGYVFRRELVCGVADQETSLSHRTVAYHDTPEHLFVSLVELGRLACKVWGGGEFLEWSTGWLT